jgi:opacity protein-like surface antigen
MPYVTGGIALSDHRIAIIGEPLGVHSELGVGFVAGGGIEIEVWQPLSVKVEYLYARYGHLTCNTACGVGAVFGTPSIGATPSENIVRFGINYRLWER